MPVQFPGGETELSADSHGDSLEIALASLTLGLMPWLFLILQLGGGPFLCLLLTVVTRLVDDFVLNSS